MMPEVFYTEWFVPETDNWHLKDGCPEIYEKQFVNWMNEHRESNAMIYD